jgi:hypothetical protein
LRGNSRADVSHQRPIPGLKFRDLRFQVPLNLIHLLTEAALKVRGFASQVGCQREAYETIFDISHSA